jgi:hypothetical protein
MSNLKSYFIQREGKTLAFSFEGGGGRSNLPHRRDYEITPKGISGELLVANVMAHDFDQSGRRISKMKKNYGIVSLPLKGLDNPTSVLDEVVRLADPGYFSNRPRVERRLNPTDVVEAAMASLFLEENREKGEISPRTASVDRFRRFWSKQVNVVPPTLFSSSDGTLRARWVDGASRTLWVNFPDKGPLGWSIAVPRDGDTGMMKVSARCLDDQDILSAARLLGVNCFSS